MIFRLSPYLLVLFMVVFYSCSNNENHVDRYQVNVDSLKILPDGFYAFRRGRLHIDKDEKYRIWFNRDNNGNSTTIFKIEDLKDTNTDEKKSINKYSIDTIAVKAIMQQFIRLSGKYKFGHIRIERKNRISFSYKDGLPEQYVKTFSDSLTAFYNSRKDFILLSNGWFEYARK